MPITYSMRGTKFKEEYLTGFGLDGDSIFKVGIEFMSFMNQTPNDVDGTFVLTGEVSDDFGEFLAGKGWKRPYITAALLIGAEWSREV